MYTETCKQIADIEKKGMGKTTKIQLGTAISADVRGIASAGAVIIICTVQYTGIGPLLVNLPYM